MDPRGNPAAGGGCRRRGDPEFAVEAARTRKNTQNLWPAAATVKVSGSPDVIVGAIAETNGWPVIAGR